MKKINIYKTVLWLTCVIQASAMDLSETAIINQVETIRDAIDKRIFNIDEKTWFRSIKGSCKSFCNRQAFFNNPQIAIQELVTIESLIPTGFKSESFFQKLHERHWHFAFLVDELARDEVSQLHQVTSSTIDMLCDKTRIIPGLSRKISTFIHTYAHNNYAKEVGLEKEIKKIPFGGKHHLLGCYNDEIHFAALETFQGEPWSLTMSDDDKYLRTITPHGKQTLWNLKTAQEAAEIVPSLEDETKQCFSNGYLVNKNDSLMAICGYTRDIPVCFEIDYVIVDYYRLKNRMPVMLFMRPTLTSWLCQQIFLKNKNNKDQLIALRDSQAVKSIEGFPRQNLLQLIDKVLSK